MSGPATLLELRLPSWRCAFLAWFCPLQQRAQLQGIMISTRSGLQVIAAASVMCSWSASPRRSPAARSSSASLRWAMNPHTGANSPNLARYAGRSSRPHSDTPWNAAGPSPVAAILMAMATGLERHGPRARSQTPSDDPRRLSCRRERRPCEKDYDRVDTIMRPWWRAGAPGRSGASRAMRRGRAGRCRIRQRCRRTRPARRHGPAIARAPAGHWRRCARCGCRSGPRHLPALHFSPKVAGRGRLGDDLVAVARVHRVVLVRMEHDGRDDAPVTVRGLVWRIAAVRSRPAAWRRRPRACRARRRRPARNARPPRRRGRDRPAP